MIRVRNCCLTPLLALLAAGASAHVPYLEEQDFSASAPFDVQDIPQSKAFYAWLEDGNDVDHYAIQVDEPTRIYLHTNIPYCREYAGFSVNYALIGPGLPAPDMVLPVALPPGHGAMVARDEFADHSERPVMFEQFSARMYWEGPERTVQVEQPGRYELIVWPEAGRAGDYVAVIGREEKFGPTDIWRALTLTPRLRAAEELHVSCADPGAAAQAAR